MRKGVLITAERDEYFCRVLDITTERDEYFCRVLDITTERDEYFGNCYNLRRVEGTICGMNSTEPSRRDLLKFVRGIPKPSGSPEPIVEDEPQLRGRAQPVGGNTVRLGIRAMACEFAAILNPGSPEQIPVVGEALECVPQIENWLSIYRPGSEISELNRRAVDEQIRVNPSFFRLLSLSKDLSEKTAGAFDLAAGALNRIWKGARHRQSIPEEHEIVDALAASGSRHLELDESTMGVRFLRPGVSLDPGAIGKGFALDEACEWLERDVAGGKRVESFLLHGGHSSLIARGTHNGLPGWPVGIGNPLFTNRRLGTILLCDQAMATSGSNIQFYRYEGRRYGHILDPRNGWPVDGMLSVTVLAASAAVADAVSTAFFVLGIEKAVLCCKNLPEVGVILIPFPEQGRRVRPHLIGISPDQIFWDSEQVDPVQVVEI
ncbi:MAG: FAD:protein FMN transferase [Planctomyces sp.]|nr:FAD:protein FMN transferase [Planctomyces sp.]